MSRGTGNNVKRYDTSCKSAIKNAFIIIIIIIIRLLKLCYWFIHLSFFT